LLILDQQTDCLLCNIYYVWRFTRWIGECEQWCQNLDALRIPFNNFHRDSMVVLRRHNAPRNKIDISRRERANSIILQHSDKKEKRRMLLRCSPLCKSHRMTQLFSSPKCWHNKLKVNLLYTRGTWSCGFWADSWSSTSFCSCPFQERRSFGTWWQRRRLSGSAGVAGWSPPAAAPGATLSRCWTGGSDWTLSSPGTSGSAPAPMVGGSSTDHSSFGSPIKRGRDRLVFQTPTMRPTRGIDHHYI